MSEDYKYPNSVKSLSVVPQPSEKVEQLKRELVANPAPPASHANSGSLIDRAVDPNKTPDQKALEEKVVEVLRTIFDPELPVNIYDLGLIYSIDASPDRRVKVKMTLTAPACPVAGSLPPEVERKIEGIPEVTSAEVELVWEPQWSREMMSEAAQLELGLF